MGDPITAVAAVLTAMGLGGAVGALIQSRLEARRAIGERKHELKERRYRTILLLMLAKLRPAMGLEKIKQVGSDLADPASLDDELQSELMYAVVFADHAVLAGIAGFLKNPSDASFTAVAVAMRQELWGKRRPLPDEVIDVLSQASRPHGVLPAPNVATVSMR